jgi:hypothetical protein
MLRSSQWRVKATEYAIKAQTVADAELRRQYAELADRYFAMAAKLDDGGMASAPRPQRWTKDRTGA